jgi:antitoxin MazE
MNTKIGKWGNSLGIRLPKYIVESLNLKVDTSLSIALDNGKIVMEISPETNLTIEDLLAQINEPPEAELSWGKPEGEEIW